jgi:hypothetical protein
MIFFKKLMVGSFLLILFLPFLYSMEINECRVSLCYQRNVAKLTIRQIHTQEVHPPEYGPPSSLIELVPRLNSIINRSHKPNKLKIILELIDMEGLNILKPILSNINYNSGYNIEKVTIRDDIGTDSINQIKTYFRERQAEIRERRIPTFFEVEKEEKDNLVGFFS